MRLRFVWLLVAAAVAAALFAIVQMRGTDLAVGSDVAAQAPAGAAMARTADGKPDLSGFWQTMNTAGFNLQDHIASEGVPAGQGVVEGNEIPYQPWALAKKQENFKNRATADPVSKCFMPGTPRATYMGFPFQIMQMPEKVAILYEFAYTVRYLYTNGTKHPGGHIGWWMGDSRARWEGDTLVADVTHFNDLTWFDRAGNFHSDALHVVERYTPIDRDHIRYEATIEDAKVFTRPWKMSMVLYRHIEPNFRVLEYTCHGFQYEDYYPYPGL